MSSVFLGSITKNVICWVECRLVYNLYIDYVRLSRNLHVHYVRLSRNLYILCTLRQKLVHTLCTFKQKFAHTLCTFKAYLQWLTTWKRRTVRKMNPMPRPGSFSTLFQLKPPSTNFSPSSLLLLLSNTLKLKLLWPSSPSLLGIVKMPFFSPLRDISAALKGWRKRFAWYSKPSRTEEDPAIC